MIIAIIIAAVLLIALLIGLYAVYHKTFYSPDRNASETESPEFLVNHPYRKAFYERVDRLIALPWETVTIRSYDGLTLSGRYYQGESGKPLVIGFHGYHGSALRDMSGLGLSLIDKGWSALFIDERAHWHSGGHTITYGIRERRDVLSWIGYANDRFGSDTPIYLFGISMGGGTVLMASGAQLPDNVRGVIADCPFNVPKDIICHVCRKIKLDPGWCWPLIWMSAWVYGHFNINKTSAAAEVKNTTKPVLIIHGEGDDFVPPIMSRQVYDANPVQVTYRTVPKAGHGLSFFYDTEKYMSIVDEFLDKNQ